MRALFNFLFMCLFWVSGTLFSLDFYVSPKGDDLAPGTIAHPWKTMQKAFDSAMPGSTVHVKAGIYYEKVALNVEGNHKEGSITFRNFEKDHVTISGEGVANHPNSYTDDIIFIDSKSYVTLQGFEIRDVDALECSGIRYTGAGSHVEIRNNVIHNIRGGGQNGGAMGITIYATDKDHALTDLVIDGNEIYDCDPAYSEALVLNGNIKNFTVSNNIVHDVNNIGIDMVGGEGWIGARQPRNGVCKGNKVFRARSQAEEGFAAGIYVDGGKDIVVEDNEVYECDLGIEIGAENQGIVASGVVIRRNRVHDNDKAGIVFGGYRKIAGRTVHCTFTENILTNNDTKNMGFGEFWVQYAVENQVNNNRINPGIQNIMISSYGVDLKNDFDNNVYCPYSSGKNPPLFIWNSHVYEGLKAFQEGTGMEHNGRLCEEAHNSTL